MSYRYPNLSKPPKARVHFSWVTSAVAEADVAELTRLATTISRCEQEVLNFHTTRISTRPVEAQNLITEKIRRIAHGMRNFDNDRLRLLLHSGVKWGHSSNCTNQRALPTASRVEPLKHVSSFRGSPQRSSNST